MLSLKIVRTVSRCPLANGVSGRLLLRSPALRSALTNTAVNRRHYSDGDNDEIVKSNKYKVFRDDDSSVILDVEEERALLDLQRADEDFNLEESDQFAGLDTSRGVSGVFEVEHLVEVLRKNNASNIFVVTVPANIRYVDYIVIASGKSQKHLMSIVEFVYILFKKKRKPSDRIPRIVNEKPTDWIALDIGNIALHLLTKETRKNFDLETIWSVGDVYDSHLNKPADSLVTLLNEHSFSLQNLEPVDVDNMKTL